MFGEEKILKVPLIPVEDNVSTPEYVDQTLLIQWTRQRNSFQGVSNFQSGAV